jgi:hypothetical protein
MLTSKPDVEACKKFNAELMTNLIARKMSKNKTFYEIKMLSQNSIHHGIGHLHGISGVGLNTQFNTGAPTGHYSH